MRKLKLVCEERLNPELMRPYKVKYETANVKSRRESKEEGEISSSKSSLGSENQEN